MWEAILSAASAVAGPLIEGIFGDDEPRRSTTRVNYKQMVRAAEAAGFNPLTVLRNGGAAGFATTIHPALASPSFVARAIGAGANAFLTNFDPHEDRREELEFKLVQAQLDNLQAGTALRRRALEDVPTYSGGTRGRMMGSEAPLPPQRPEVGRVTATNPWKSAVIDPSARDAEAFETRYGDELGGFIGGALAAEADAKANMAQWPLLTWKDWSFTVEEAMDQWRKWHQ